MTFSIFYEIPFSFLLDVIIAIIAIIATFFAQAIIAISRLSLHILHKQ
jgi:hypothetical protein